MPVPALVDSALFAAVQEQLAENRRRNRQNRRGQRYLLQGLLVCRRCGYAYYGKAISPRGAKGKRRDYAYYRCCGSDAYRFGGQRLCANPQLRTDRTDAAVWQEVQRLLQNPDLIAAEYERRLHQAQHPDADRPDLVTAEAQIAKLRRGVARLIDGYAEGLIEKAEFEQRITGLRQRIKVWEQQAAALQDEAALNRTLSLIIGRLEDFAKQIQQRMSTPDWWLQRDLIRLLVNRVEVDHDEINVVFRVAPPPGSLPPSPKGGRSLQDCWRSDHILAWPKTHDHDAVLIPAARILVGADTTQGTAAIDRLQAACVAHLRARIAEPLSPPADWQRASTLPCRCQHCAELARFLADPERKTWVLKAAEAARSHVEESIRQAGSDLNTTTDRRGRPYSLVCTKNQASYDRR